MLCSTHTQRDLFRPELDADVVEVGPTLEQRAGTVAVDDAELRRDLLRLPVEELARIVVAIEDGRVEAAMRGAAERARLAELVRLDELEAATRPSTAPKRFQPDRDADPPTPRNTVTSSPGCALPPFSGAPQAPIFGGVHPKEAIVTDPSPRIVPTLAPVGEKRACRCYLAGCPDCDAYNDADQMALRDAAEHLRRPAANAVDLRPAPTTSYIGAPSIITAAEPVPRAVKAQADSIAHTAAREKALQWVRGLDTSTGNARAWRIALCCRPVVAIQAKPGRLKVGWQLLKCRDRACPACAASRSRELTAAARAHVAALELEEGAEARFVFATLTQRKDQNEGCSAAFERLMATWHKVYRRSAFTRCFAGGLRGTEVPYLEPEKGNSVVFPGWHAHFHMALQLAPGVSRWYAECVLRSLWIEASMVAAGWEFPARGAVVQGCYQRDGYFTELDLVLGELRDRLEGLDVQVLDDANIGQVTKYVTKPFELPPEKAPKFFRAMKGRKMCAGFGTWRRFLHSTDDRGGPQWYTTTTFRKLREVAREDGMVEVWATRREEPNSGLAQRHPSLFASFLRGDKGWHERLRSALRAGTVTIGTSVRRHAAEIHHAEQSGRKWAPLTALQTPPRRVWYDDEGERHETHGAPYREGERWHKGRTSDVFLGELPAREIVRRLKADPRPTWEQSHSAHCREHACGNTFRCEECDELLGTCMLEAGYEQNDVCEDCWPEWARNLGLPVPESRFG